MRKIKVLFFLPGCVGGAERMTVSIAGMLQPELYDIRFVVVGNEIGRIADFLPANSNVRLLRIRKIWQLATLRFIRLLRKERPDFVFSSLMYLNVRLIAAARSVGGIKIIVRNDNSLSFADALTAVLVRLTYHMADMIIAQQETMADEIRRLPFVSASRVVTLHNPIDTSLIDEKVSEAESPYPADGCINYVNVASVCERKGQDILLKAFDLCHKSNERCRLYLVGTVTDPDFAARLHSYIASNGLEGYVHFVGYTDNPYRWMKHSHCFVLSSRIEGLPNALVEANYLKVPCVSTMCVPTVDEIIENGVNGYLVPLNDPESMAGAMSRAVSMSGIVMKYKPGDISDFRNLFK